MRKIHRKKINEFVRAITAENGNELSSEPQSALLLYLVIKRAIKTYKSSTLSIDKKIPTHQHRLIQNIKPILADLKHAIDDPTIVLDPYKIYSRLDKTITAVNDPIDFAGCLRAFFINNDFGELGNLLAAIINIPEFHPHVIHSELFQATSKDELAQLYEEREQFRITIENLTERVSFLEKQLGPKISSETESTILSNKKRKEKFIEKNTISRIFSIPLSNSCELPQTPHDYKQMETLSVDSSRLTLPNNEKIVFASVETIDRNLQFNFLFKEEKFLFLFSQKLEENLGFSLKADNKGKMLSFFIDSTFRNIVVFTVQNILKENVMDLKVEI